MPKIEAPTVAEHRASQERALLSAAKELLLSRGPQAVTPASVGAAAGLARSSVYKYFGSSEEILSRIVAESFDDWGERVRHAVSEVDNPDGQIRSYVSTNLELAAAGHHRVAVLGGGAPASASARQYLARHHEKLAETLRAALIARGDPDPALTANLIDGALGRAIRLLDAGVSAGKVNRLTLTFLLRAIGVATDNPPNGPHKKE